MITHYKVPVPTWWRTTDKNWSLTLTSHSYQIRIRTFFYLQKPSVEILQLFSLVVDEGQCSVVQLWAGFSSAGVGSSLDKWCSCDSWWPLCSSPFPQRSSFKVYCIVFFFHTQSFCWTQSGRDILHTWCTSAQIHSLITVHICWVRIINRKNLDKPGEH